MPMLIPEYTKLSTGTLLKHGRDEQGVYAVAINRGPEYLITKAELAEYASIRKLSSQKDIQP